MPDGKTVLSGGADGKIKFWDAEEHKLKNTVDGNPGGVLSIVASTDGKSIFCAGADGKILVLNPDGTKAKTIDAGGQAVKVVVYGKSSS